MDGSRSSDGTTTLQIGNVDPIQIIIRDLSYGIGGKAILEDINTVFQPGRLSVIVGPSGSGKTTLLSIIAGLPGNASKSERAGEILFNGTQLSPETIRKIVGFVFQDDVILETMTVEEAIDMSVKLRVKVPRSKTTALKNRMLDLSKLQKSKNVVIGSPAKKGISGGERKRTAIAMELVSNPSVLLLDEPTSGLDAYTAYRTVALLKRLARKYGRTVIATLHQPSSEIFHMIDDLYVLHEGRIVFAGPSEKIVPYFSEAGYHFDKYSNPLDVLFMNILNRASKDEFSDGNGLPDERGSDTEDADAIVPVDRLPSHYKESALYIHMMQIIQLSGGTTKGMLRYRARRGRAFRLLLVRNVKNVFRNPMVVRTKLFQTLFMALFIAAAFSNTRHAAVPAIYQNISGILFLLVTNAFFTSFQNVLPVFSSEKPSFSREHSQGYYDMSSYFFAKILVELPLTVIFPIITASIVYWIVGLRPGFGHFVVLTVILQLVALSGFTFGLFSASIFDDVAIALALSILILLPFMILGGLFLNLSTVPVYMRWIAWISPMRYGFNLLMTNQFDGWDAPGAQQYFNNSSISNGLPFYLNVIILIALFLGALVLAYFALIRVVLNNEGRGIQVMVQRMKAQKTQKAQKAQRTGNNTVQDRNTTTVQDGNAVLTLGGGGRSSVPIPMYLLWRQ